MDDGNRKQAACAKAAEESGAPRACPQPTVYKAVLWATRVAVLAVFLMNVQCAVQFIVWPDAFAPAYELSGVAGNIAVQGLGVAFLMWNATYPPVIVDPVKHRPLFAVVLAQQTIGFIGESAILASIPAGHDLLASSIARFVAFDGAGLVAMAAAYVALSLFSKRMRAT